ncbi:hypothetical protein FRB90_012449 [Tulasnella sp. 427]|nr:hypothetical protein FRB90_012449 [Tulasnella sp. 427]
MFTPLIGRPEEVIELAVQYTQSSPAGYYGPCFLSLIGVSIMMGVMLIQVTRYFSAFGFESPGRFALIMVSVSLFLVDWSITVSVEWVWFAAHYGDVRRFVSVPWQVWLGPPIGQLTAFTSQIFFARRCYKLYDGNIFLLLGLFAGMLSSLVLTSLLAATIAIDPFNAVAVRNLSVPALLINLLTDRAITGLTLWKLAGHRGKDFSSGTHDILRQLRRVTVEAALPPAICALLNMAFYLGMGNKNLVFVFFGSMTPCMYISSMMWMLNSRITIRQHLSSSNDQNQAGTGAGTYEFSKVTTSRRIQRQSLQNGGNGRGSVIFSSQKKPAYGPNVSIGAIAERIEPPSEAISRLASFKVDEDDSVSQSEAKVDLEGWVAPPKESAGLDVNVVQDDSDVEPFPSKKRAGDTLV